MRTVSEVLFPTVLALALAAFGFTIARRTRLLLAAKPACRPDRVGARVKRTLVYAFGQAKFISGEQPAGLMHFVIFWGFLILSLQAVTMFGRAFDVDWFIPGFAPGQPLGSVYPALRDIAEALVIIAVCYAVYRRLVARTPRLRGFRPPEEDFGGKRQLEAIAILVLILTVAVTGMVYDSTLVVADPASRLGLERASAPLARLLATLTDGLGGEREKTLNEAVWWLHNLVVIGFLNLLPLSKHFHIITAIPNVFLGKLEPRNVTRTMRTERARPLGVASLAGASGVIAALDQFSRKQVLDLYSCTECGRCSAVCPATASGTALAPRQLILDLRDYAYGRKGELLSGGADESSGRLVSSEVLWACTTCLACVEACPVGIEHVPTIVEMRRALLDEGELDTQLQSTLETIQRSGNSLGEPARRRGRWTRQLEFEIPDARNEPVEYLWFVGDFASFDPRSQATSQRLARLLRDARVSFGLLYDAERNAGNDVRRVGEEGLFKLLVAQNMDALASAEFEAIFTTDPHSFNTLRNEYPDFGLNRPVYHYTELLLELIRTGDLQMHSPLAGMHVTYHDPCYLARYNRITKAPRELLRATGATLVEMPRHGTNTYCCGAGGGRIWMKDAHETVRPSEQRIREAQALGDLDYFVVSCPKDLTMYSDAATTLGAGFEVVDISSLVEKAVVPGT